MPRRLPKHAWKKGVSGNPNGRPKGAQNKVTLIAKDVINTAAENLGGAEGLARWAKKSAKNERAFWTIIYPKLLPLQITGPGGGAIPVDLQVEAQAARFMEDLTTLVTRMHRAPEPPKVVDITPNVRLVEGPDKKRKLANG